jgi:hypothetical protein
LNPSVVVRRRRHPRPLRGPPSPCRFPPLKQAVRAWEKDGYTSEVPSATDAQPMPAISSLGTSGGSFAGTDHRSRSSPINLVHQPTVGSAHSTMPPTQSPDEIGMHPMHPNKKPTLQDIRKSRIQSQPATFEQGYRQQDPNFNHHMRPSAFDGQCPTAGSMNLATYGVGSVMQGSYLNPPEHSTAPYSYPVSSMGQPAAYPSPTSYGPIFAENFPPPNAVGLGHTVTTQHSMMSVPTTPVYEQSVHTQQIQNYPMVSNPYHGELVSDHPQSSIAMYDGYMDDSTSTGILRW